MKFSAIVGNPPYQKMDNGNGASASPIYQYFISQAKALSPDYISMICPSRWFNGGKGLDKFREEMLSDNKISQIVDFQNAKDCFPTTSISGGVCYFLWEKAKCHNECQVINMMLGKTISCERSLTEFPIFVRYNNAVSIIRKVTALNEKLISDVFSSRNPYGLPTNIRGKEKEFNGAVKLISSGGIGFIERNKIGQGKCTIDKYKTMVSRITCEHAGEPDKTGMFKVIATAILLNPNEVCTDSYIIGFPTESKRESENFLKYLKTKFVRFLIMQTMSSINLTKEKYGFVPMQDFSKSWDDRELYRKYMLSNDEISFIESIIKPME